MQQTPTQEPLQEQVSAEAQETVTQPPLEETLTFAPEKKGKLGKNIKRIILMGSACSRGFLHRLRDLQPLFQKRTPARDDDGLCQHQHH